MAFTALELLNSNNANLPSYSFAWAELYQVLALVLMRFDLALYDTIRERDVKIHHDYFFGEPAFASKGVQMRVVGLRNKLSERM